MLSLNSRLVRVLRLRYGNHDRAGKPVLRSEDIVAAGKRFDEKNTEHRNAIGVYALVEPKRAVSLPCLCPWTFHFDETSGRTANLAVRMVGKSVRDFGSGSMPI